MPPAKDEIDIEGLKFPSDSLTLGQIRKALGPEQYSDHRKIMGVIGSLRNYERTIARNAIDEAKGGDDASLAKTFKDAAVRDLTATLDKVGIGATFAEQMIRDLERDAVALIPGIKK